MNEKQRAASDVVGPELLKLLGLPEMTEKVTITLEGGEPIRVECVSFANGAAGAELVTTLREYGVTGKIVA